MPSDGSTPAASQPIFVVGYQRSGTTLLQSMLGAHPAIAAPPETYFVFRIANLRGYYGDLTIDANLRRVIHDTIHPTVPVLEELGLDEERLYRAAHGSARDYATVFDVVMSEIAHRWGKRRWSDKSPGQSVDAALALFPDARVVHIIRDPRDVVASSLETPWTPGSSRQIARSWRDFTTRCLRAGLRAGPRRYLAVRYEDLVGDPESLLRRICHFVGEDFDLAMLDPDERRRAGTVVAVAAPWQARAVEPVTTERQGRHRQVLSRWQRASIAAAVQGQVAALGYEPDSTRTVAVGRVINAARAMEDLPDVYRRARLRRHFTPARHYEEVQRFLHRNRRVVADDRSYK